MSLSEKEFVDKVFVIEGEFEALKLIAVNCFATMFICVIMSVMIAEFFVGFAFIFCVVGCVITLFGVEYGYFPVMNFRKAYMPTYSYEELDFMNRCETINPYAISNLVKYEHLFVE